MFRAYHKRLQQQYVYWNEYYFVSFSSIDPPHLCTIMHFSVHELAFHPLEQNRDSYDNLKILSMLPSWIVSLYN